MNATKPTKGEFTPRLKDRPWLLIAIAFHLVLLLGIFAFLVLPSHKPEVTKVNLPKVPQPEPKALGMETPRDVIDPVWENAEVSGHNETADDESFHRSKGDSMDFVSDKSLHGRGVYETVGVSGGAGGRYGGPRGGRKTLVSNGGGSIYQPAHGGTRIVNNEAYDAMFFKHYGVNPFVDTEDDHFSTFAIDVDNASYTVARSYFKDGNLPPNEAVRVEEFINFFDYQYKPPDKDAFAIYLEGTPSKFGKNCQMFRVGLKAKEISAKDRKDAILTFVIDVSGSMQREDRLGLVKKSLRLLIDQLRKGDKIGIAIYGSRGQILMEHKGIDRKSDILCAIDSLQAGGSTFAEEGIRLGYELADKYYQKGCINRIILCSDGVANVGLTGAKGILKVIKKYTENGIYLSSIGFGMGNYNDVLLEKLGNKGNGHYAYVDNITEAKRVFVKNLTGTLQVVAKDVKVQVDFNPAVVRSYRLLGYENRAVADDKFRDDKEDGGEIGAGHSVTALYEIKLWEEKQGRAATLYVRYKNPDNDEVSEVSREINTKEFGSSFEEASDSFRLSALVAEFAEIIRKSYWAQNGDLETVLNLTRSLSSKLNNNPNVIELTDLISKAKVLKEKLVSDAKQNR